MDVVRTQSKSRRKLVWALLSLAIVGLCGAATVVLTQLKPALPTFERSTVTIDTVRRGDILKEVAASGTLVPVVIKWITADVGGQIVEVCVEPGIVVTPGMELVKLHDRALDNAVRDAERDLTAAESDLQRFQLQQAASQYDLKLLIASARADFETAREQAEIDEAMARSGVRSARQWQFAVDKAERSELLYEVQVEKAANSVESQAIQKKEKEEAIARAKDRLAERREQLASLIVKANTEGVLEQFGQTGTGLDIGQRIGPGSVVAKISNPKELKAVVFVSQVQAREVVVGQPATIDTRTGPAGIIQGQVSYIAPNVLNDRVTVEIRLQGTLPPGARPDLSVEAKIEVSQLNDVLYVRKPEFSQENGRLELFRLGSDDITATRQLVEFGRGTQNSLEVLNGLKEGDQIIVSGTSRWKTHEVIKLK